MRPGPNGVGDTKPTQIRIPEKLKLQAKAKAYNEYRTLSDVVIAALESYVRGTNAY